MIIDLKTIKYYYLTTGTNKSRINHINTVLKEYDITEVNTILGIGKQKSGSIGTCRMVDIGLKNQKRDEPFQPFIILEDDISIYNKIPDTLEIPKDADILYVGISMAGLGNNKRWSKTDVLYATDINNTIVRVYNMLATHAVMICSAAGAGIYQRCMMENYFNERAWDMYLSEMQPYYNVYALKTPLFYQDKNYGGIEWATKITLANKKIHFDTQKLPASSKLSKIYIPPPKKKVVDNVSIKMGVNLSKPSRNFEK